MGKHRFRVAGASIALGLAIAVPGSAAAQDDREITIRHAYTVESWDQMVDEQLARFTEQTGIKVNVAKIGVEDFKTVILAELAGDNPPDAFNYAAGARVQFVVDAGKLAPIDDLWQDAGLGEVFPAAIADGASIYDGQHYLIPMEVQFVGLMTNPEVLEAAGVTEAPTDWEGFLAVLDNVKASGVTPIALGSSERWPAQFWFDYLLLRTAGPEYRDRLMNGEASYTDPEVQRVMEMWAQLVEGGFFTENPNAYTWSDAADQVARGEAAMTLLGSWVPGYWDGQGLKVLEDYDFFRFPDVDEGVDDAVLGVIQGFVTTAAAHDLDAGKQLLRFLASKDVQEAFAAALGSPASSSEADTSGYNDVVKRGVDLISGADTFQFHYDLATPPPVAEVGLNMFQEFLNDPASWPELLERAEQDAETAFQSDAG